MPTQLPNPADGAGNFRRLRSGRESATKAPRPTFDLGQLGLIRSRGHVPKGGYDVPNGSNHTSAVTPAIQ